MSLLLKNTREHELQLLHSHPLPTWILDAEKMEVLYNNPAATDFLQSFGVAGFSGLVYGSGKTSFQNKVFTKSPHFKCRVEVSTNLGLTEVELYASAFFYQEKFCYQVSSIAIPHQAKEKVNTDELSKELKDSKKEKERLKLLANLVEQTSDILTAADLNYVPLTWNSAAERIYGIPGEKIIGKPFRDFIDISYGSVTREQIRAVVDEKGEWTGEASFIRPGDGRQITLIMSFKKLNDENGEPLGILVSARDITERKESEERLRESENRFREMADSSPVMIWMTDEFKNVIYLNREFRQFTGQDISDTREGWLHLMHEEDVKPVVESFEMAYFKRQKASLNYRLRNRSGQYRWMHDVSVPRFSGGRFLGYIGSTVDMEEQKQRELQLSHHATILENVTDIIVSTGLDFRVRTMNPSAEFYYGLTEAEAGGQFLHEVLKLEFISGSLEQLIFRLENFGIWKGEIAVINHQGEKRFTLQSIKEIRNERLEKTGYLAVGKDITEMKNAQKRLGESEEFYRTLIADSLDGMILVNPEGNITFASPSVKNVLGYEVHEVVGRNGFEFIHPDDILWSAKSLDKEVFENPSVKYIVVRLKKKSGDWVWCMVRGKNMLAHPVINSVAIYFHDDTLRKQATQALKESEQRFRNLISDLQVGVFLSDNQGKINLCNKAIADMVRLSEEQICGKHVYELLNSHVTDENGELIPLEQRPLTRALQTGESVTNFVGGIIHPVSGETAWILVNCSPVMNENGEIMHTVTSVMDITERKKLEQKLMQGKIAHQKQLTQATLDGQEAERKEIGKELHDNIGQQLTTIKLFLDLAASSADEETLEMVSMAQKGVSDVINDVRAMSHSLVPSTLQDLGLKESINELTDSIVRTQVLELVVDHSDFNENLLPDNQKLTIYRIVQEQLNNIVKHSGAGKVSISITSSKNVVKLVITDDGKGFDPKKTRRGLGFINIGNRVELFGGRSKIRSAPGKGCTLEVEFPMG